MNKIGVIGPEISLKRIHEVAKTYKHDIDFIYFSYEDVRDTVEIVKVNRDKVDGWFFSGPTPYIMAEDVLDPNENYIYCLPTGTGLYKSIIAMLLENQGVMKNFSIDMVYTEELSLQESLTELEIPTLAYYVKLFDKEFDHEEILQYHLQLWREKKVEVVITSLHTVYVELQKREIPVYRATVTKMEIRHAMEILVEQARSSYFKKNQIGVEIIEVDGFDKLANEVQTRYHIQHEELKIKKMLLEFCERLDGSLIENGNGRYQIFSTRRAIEQEIDTLYYTAQQVELEIGFAVSVGVGFGETAFSAEINARKAIQFSKQKNNSDNDKIVIVQEDGSLIESRGSGEELTYHYRFDNQELTERLNKAKVNISTYKKIEALVHRMEWDGFTTADLATHLSMTVRNAQRIMNSLLNHGLAISEGKETSGGRPRKLYKLKNMS